MIPTRRDYRFTLPAESVTQWHQDGVLVTNFLNTLSAFFPEGERFFIRAVRAHREHAKDPALQKAVAGFIGQEAMHGREHDDYNDLLADAGLPVKAQEAQVKVLLDWAEKNLGPEMCLNATVALEHLTAMMGHFLLDRSDFMDRAEPHYAQLWRWHALEETEHKGVAWDVWKTVMRGKKREYPMRVAGLALTNAIFWPLVAVYFAQNLKVLKAKGHKVQKGDARRLLSNLFGRRSVLGAQIPLFLSYLKPSFHPWDHQNGSYLQQLEGFTPAP